MAPQPELGLLAIGHSRAGRRHRRDTGVAGADLSGKARVPVERPRAPSPVAAITSLQRQAMIGTSVARADGI